MFPVLFQVGPIKIFTYGLLLAIAFISALYLAGRAAKRQGGDPQVIYDLGFYIVIAAIIGSRLFHVLLEWPYFVAHPWEILYLWKGGLAFQGGLIFGFLTAIFYIWRRGLPFWSTLDILAVGMPFGQFVGRLGCLMAGCCYGKPTDLPWGITFKHPETLAYPRGVPLHPTQLYESLLSLGVFFFLQWLLPRQRFPGQILATYFILAGAVRFLVEFWRGDDRGPILFWQFPTTQVVALGLAGAGLILWLWRSRSPANPS